MTEYTEVFRGWKTIIANIPFFLFFVFVFVYAVLTLQYLQTLPTGQEVMGLIFFIISILQILSKTPRTRLVFEEVKKK